MMIHNFLTFDIEEGYHVNYRSVDVAGHRIEGATSVAANVDRLIGLCEQYRVRSTCFVLGCVAEKKPRIVRRLFESGHEIASHGYEHEPVSSMSPEAFGNDLEKSCRILEDITGEKVLGYRAPSWSVSRGILPWYYSILQDAGLVYSSSVYPGKTYLYGIPDFGDRMIHPVVHGKESKILEIPVPVIRFLGKTIGFSGGFFFRLFPLRLIMRAIDGKNQKGQSVFLYLHPREMGMHQPKLSLNAVETFIHYHGLRKVNAKLHGIMKAFAHSFIPIRDAIRTTT